MLADIIGLLSQAIFLASALFIIIHGQRQSFVVSVGFTIGYALFALSMYISGLMLSATCGCIGASLWGSITWRLT